MKDVHDFQNTKPVRHSAVIFEEPTHVHLYRMTVRWYHDVSFAFGLISKGSCAHAASQRSITLTALMDKLGTASQVLSEPYAPRIPAGTGRRPPIPIGH